MDGLQLRDTEQAGVQGESRRGAAKFETLKVQICSTWVHQCRFVDDTRPRRVRPLKSADSWSDAFSCMGQTPRNPAGQLFHIGLVCHTSAFSPPPLLSFDSLHFGCSGVLLSAPPQIQTYAPQGSTGSVAECSYTQHCSNYG